MHLSPECPAKMDPDDGNELIEAVVTCEGNLHDPDFSERFQILLGNLKSILYKSKEEEEQIKVKKVEPWNSVRVTISIPKEAAQKLRLLAQQGSNVLKSLGILTVQLEGDQVISLTLAGQNNTPGTEIVLRQSSSSSNDGSGPSSSSSSSTAFPFSLPMAPSGQSVVLSGPTSTSLSAFRSPNVVAPGGELIPVLPPSTNTIKGNITRGPFPFASMTHAAQTMQRTDPIPSSSQQQQHPPPSPVASSSATSSANTVKSNNNNLINNAVNSTNFPVVSSPQLSQQSNLLQLNAKNSEQVSRFVMQQQQNQLQQQQQQNLLNHHQQQQSQSLQLQIVNVNAPPPYPGVNSSSSGINVLNVSATGTSAINTANINTSSNSNNFMGSNVNSNHHHHQQQQQQQHQQQLMNSAIFSSVGGSVTVSSPSVSVGAPSLSNNNLTLVRSASSPSMTSQQLLDDLLGTGNTSHQPMSSPLLVNLLQNNDQSVGIQQQSSSSNSSSSSSGGSNEMLQQGQGLSGAGTLEQKQRLMLQQQQQLHQLQQQRKMKRVLSLDGASSEIVGLIRPQSSTGGGSGPASPAIGSGNIIGPSDNFLLPSNRVSGPVNVGQPRVSSDLATTATIIQGRTIIHQGNVRVFNPGQIRAIRLSNQSSPSSPIQFIQGKHPLPPQQLQQLHLQQQKLLQQQQQQQSDLVLSNGPNPDPIPPTSTQGGMIDNVLQQMDQSFTNPSSRTYISTSGSSNTFIPTSSSSSSSSNFVPSHPHQQIQVVPKRNVQSSAGAKSSSPSHPHHRNKTPKEISSSGKPRQLLINPLTGHLEPMPSDSSSEGSDEEGKKGRPHQHNNHVSKKNKTKGGKNSLKNFSNSRGGIIQHRQHVTTTTTGVTVARVVKSSSIDSPKSGGTQQTGQPKAERVTVVPGTISSGQGMKKEKLESGEKIKLRLKLEKSEPISPAYKVDVSFVKKSEKSTVVVSGNSSSGLGTSGVPGGNSPSRSSMGSPGDNQNQQPRVPPLHISLRGKNAAVVVSSPVRSSSIDEDNNSSSSPISFGSDGKTLKSGGRRTNKRVRSSGGSSEIDSLTGGHGLPPNKISRPRLSKEDEDSLKGRLTEEENKVSITAVQVISKDLIVGTTSNPSSLGGAPIPSTPTVKLKPEDSLGQLKTDEPPSILQATSSLLFQHLSKKEEKTIPTPPPLPLTAALTVTTTTTSVTPVVQKDIFSTLTTTTTTTSVLTLTSTSTTSGGSVTTTLSSGVSVSSALTSKTPPSPNRSPTPPFFLPVVVVEQQKEISQDKEFSKDVLIVAKEEIHPPIIPSPPLPLATDTLTEENITLVKNIPKLFRDNKPKELDLSGVSDSIIIPSGEKSTTPISKSPKPLPDLLALSKSTLISTTTNNPMSIKTATKNSPEKCSESVAKDKLSQPLTSSLIPVTVNKFTSTQPLPVLKSPFAPSLEDLKDPISYQNNPLPKQQPSTSIQSLEFTNIRDLPLKPSTPPPLIIKQEQSDNSPLIPHTTLSTAILKQEQSITPNVLLHQVKQPIISNESEVPSITDIPINIPKDQFKTPPKPQECINLQHQKFLELHNKPNIHNLLSKESPTNNLATISEQKNIVSMVEAPKENILPFESSAVILEESKKDNTNLNETSEELRDNVDLIFTLEENKSMSVVLTLEENSSAVVVAPEESITPTIPLTPDQKSYAVEFLTPKENIQSTVIPDEKIRVTMSSEIKINTTEVISPDEKKMSLNVAVTPEEKKPIPGQIISCRKPDRSVSFSKGNSSGSMKVKSNSPRPKGQISKPKVSIGTSIDADLPILTPAPSLKELLAKEKEKATKKTTMENKSVSTLSETLRVSKIVEFVENTPIHSNQLEKSLDCIEKAKVTPKLEDNSVDIEEKIELGEPPIPSTITPNAPLPFPLAPEDPNGAHGEDSGIDSMDALSEKSPNQGESPARKDIEQFVVVVDPKYDVAYDVGKSSIEVSISNPLTEQQLNEATSATDVHKLGEHKPNDKKNVISSEPMENEESKVPLSLKDDKLDKLIHPGPSSLAINEFEQHKIEETSKLDNQLEKYFTDDLTKQPKEKLEQQVSVEFQEPVVKVPGTVLSEIPNSQEISQLLSPKKSESMEELKLELTSKSTISERQIIISDYIKETFEENQQPKTEVEDISLSLKVNPELQVQVKQSEQDLQKIDKKMKEEDITKPQSSSQISIEKESEKCQLIKTYEDQINLHSDKDDDMKEEITLPALKEIKPEVLTQSQSVPPSIVNHVDAIQELNEQSMKHQDQVTVKKEMVIVANLNVNAKVRKSKLENIVALIGTKNIEKQLQSKTDPSDEPIDLVKSHSNSLTPLETFVDQVTLDQDNVTEMNPNAESSLLETYKTEVKDQSELIIEKKYNVVALESEPVQNSIASPIQTVATTSSSLEQDKLIVNPVEPISIPPVAQLVNPIIDVAKINLTPIKNPEENTPTNKSSSTIFMSSNVDSSVPLVQKQKVQPPPPPISILLPTRATSPLKPVLEPQVKMKPRARVKPGSGSPLLRRGGDGPPKLSKATETDPRPESANPPRLEMPLTGENEQTAATNLNLFLKQPNTPTTTIVVPQSQQQSIIVSQLSPQLQQLRTIVQTPQTITNSTVSQLMGQALLNHTGTKIQIHSLTPNSQLTQQQQQSLANMIQISRASSVQLSAATMAKISTAISTSTTTLSPGGISMSAIANAVGSLHPTTTTIGGSAQPGQTLFTIHPNLTNLPANLSHLQGHTTMLPGGQKIVPVKLVTIPRGQTTGQFQTIPLSGITSSNRASPNILEAVNIVGNASGSRSNSPKTIQFHQGQPTTPGQINLSSIKSLTGGGNLHLVPISSMTTGTTNPVKVIVSSPIKMQQSLQHQPLQLVKSVMMSQGQQATTIRVVRPIDTVQNVPIVARVSSPTLLKPITTTKQESTILNSIVHPFEDSGIKSTSNSIVNPTLYVSASSSTIGINSISSANPSPSPLMNSVYISSNVDSSAKVTSPVAVHLSSTNQMSSLTPETPIPKPSSVPTPMVEPVYKHVDELEVLDDSGQNEEDDLPFEADIIHDEKDLEDVLAGCEVVDENGLDDYETSLENEVNKPVVANCCISDKRPLPDSPNLPLMRSTSPLFTYGNRSSRNSRPSTRSPSSDESDVHGEDQEIIDSFTRSPSQPKLSPQNKPVEEREESPTKPELTTEGGKRLDQELSIEIPPVDLMGTSMSPGHSRKLESGERKSTRSTRSNTRLVSPDITAFRSDRSDTPKPSKFTAKTDSLILRNSPKPSPTGSLKILSPSMVSGLAITPSSSNRSSPINHPVTAGGTNSTTSALTFSIDKMTANTNKKIGGKRKRQESDSSSCSKDENIGEEKEKTVAEIDLNSRPGKRRCSENAAELIKVCIGIEDTPKRNTMLIKRMEESNKLKEAKLKKAMATVVEENEDDRESVGSNFSRGRSRSSRGSSEDRSSSRGSSVQRSSSAKSSANEDAKSKPNNRGGTKDKLKGSGSDSPNPNQNSGKKKTKDGLKKAGGGAGTKRPIRSGLTKEKSPLTPAKTRTNVRKEISSVAPSGVTNNATAEKSSVSVNTIVSGGEGENLRRKTRSSAAVDTSSDSEIAAFKRRRISKDTKS